MKKQVLNNVSAIDVQAVQASLAIPLMVTSICVMLDILFHIRLKMVNCKNFAELAFWISSILISYFFPSILALACSLFWQYYFSDNWSGVKNEKGCLLFLLTLIYFVTYLVYLLYADTVFRYAFVVMNISYVLIVLNKCMDEKIFKKCSNRPKNKIKNAPFGEGK